MTTAIWTLWIVTFSNVVGPATPVVTPLAGYSTHDDCWKAVAQVRADMQTQYPKGATLYNPGQFMCIYGAPEKR